MTYSVVYRRVPKTSQLIHSFIKVANVDQVIQMIRLMQPDNVESEIISIVEVERES